jgi:hypothetical protein
MTKNSNTRTLAYDKYANISKANLVVNAVQAVHMTKQTRIMEDVRDSLGSIASTMDDIKKLQQNTLAIQQELLTRDTVQSDLEEFIYNIEKMVSDFSTEKSEIAPSSRYFTLKGVLETVSQEGIGTPLIRGRDNKAAYEKAMAHANDLFEELKKDSEVIEAIKWAKNEDAKRKQDLEIKCKALNDQYEIVKNKIIPHEMPSGEAVVKEHLINTKSLVMKHVPGSVEVMKHVPGSNFIIKAVAGFILMFLYMFMIMTCYIYFPFLIKHKEQKMKEMDDKINKETRNEMLEIKKLLSEAKAELNKLEI